MITDEFLNKKATDNLVDDPLKNLKASTKIASSYAGYDFTKDISKNLGKEMASKANAISGKLLSQKNNVMNTALNGLSTISSKLSFKMPKFKFNINDGRSKNESLIRQLIKLIMGIIYLPMRFKSMGESLKEASIALGVGIDGLAKSTILGIKDIIMLIGAIILILGKYFACIISFIITTIAGCFLIHAITFLFYVLYLIFPVSAYFVKMASGYDIMPTIDAGFEQLSKVDDQLGEYTGVYVLKWPDAINKICYSCFGIPVKMRDIIVDVDIIKDIGEIIAYDFGSVMPVYMRPSKPHLKLAGQYLDATFR